MSNSRALSAPLALLLLHSLLFLVSAQRSTWNTLGGNVSCFTTIYAFLFCVNFAFVCYFELSSDLDGWLSLASS